ncbi:MAG: serine/threonine protein kinase [Chrysothrix sp. TS-e1954]|nr:MAG: serine/threonine protein kinase [Chrysothrix sp. TS-e1954]
MVNDAGGTAADQCVRFSDKKEEIEPATMVEHSKTASDEAQVAEREQISPEMQKELRNLSMSMQKSNVRSKRMENFAFEPVSLPASRAPSPSGSRPASRLASNRASPLNQTPPLTPAQTGQPAKDARPAAARAPPPSTITPQMSPPQETSAAASGPPSRSQSPPGKRRAPESAAAVNRVAGGAASPLSQSRDQSPARKGSSDGVTSPRSGVATVTDQEAPQTRNKRPPQTKGSDLDPRFIFGGYAPKDAGRGSQQYSAMYDAPQKSSTSSSDLKPAEKQRRSGFFGSHHHQHLNEDDHNKHSGSMHDLKRFFKFGGHKHKHESPPATADSRKASKTGTMTPPHHRDSRASIQSAAMPFADDHGLESKYGKFGKVLGSGAGGSVRLLKRSSDGVTFAVKQFRDRHPHESERDYNKKVTAEFCVGSTLHHGNIIETMDIIHEKGKWYEVMEYAPFDLFATVMTGKMSKEEVTCAYMQIVSGVRYLHGMGLAHRDLKLDNVVMNDQGIMKLIDFGSAVVFRYPFEEDVVKASGIVGSDPYLAPEVYHEGKYDPEAVDIWSIAIIYCCMTLRRFPWKLPRTSDVSYKYFAAEPTPGTPTVDSLRRRTSSSHSSDRSPSHSHSTTRSDGHDSSHRHASESHDGARDASHGEGKEQSSTTPSIRGPWRLLRLLPRESRYIIGRMLDTNPETRITLDDACEDEWMATRPFCRQEDGGKVIRAEGHTHVMEPGSAA